MSTVLLVGVAAAGAVGSAAVDWAARRGERRLRAADEAGRAAAESARSAEAAHRPRAVRIEVYPNGEDGLWRWLAWDADRDNGSGRVHGHLVPFALNDVGLGTPEAALAEARAFVQRWAGAQGRVVGMLVELPLADA